jgi:hypothetical protein
MSLQQRFDAPVDAIALRSDGLVVACTSNVFGNSWDGGIVVIAPGQFGQSKGFQKVPTPSGCTDVAFLGSAATAIAVSCDDGNVAIYNLNGHGINGVPVKLFTDHENSVTSVSTSVAQPGNLLSASMDCSIVQYSTEGTDSSSVHEYKGAHPKRSPAPAIHRPMCLACAPRPPRRRLGRRVQRCQPVLFRKRRPGWRGEALGRARQDLHRHAPARLPDVLRRVAPWGRPAPRRRRRGGRHPRLRRALPAGAGRAAAWRCACPQRGGSEGQGGTEQDCSRSRSRSHQQQLQPAAAAAAAAATQASSGGGGVAGAALMA